MDDNELAQLFAQHQLTFKKARPCPRPDKLSYPNEQSATQAAIDRSVIYQHELRPYHCICDHWHLTSHPPKEGTP
jgi:hypothetical protein